MADKGGMGDFFNSIGSGVGTAAGDVGNFVGGIGNDIGSGVSSLFGGSTPAASANSSPMSAAGQSVGSAPVAGAAGGGGTSASSASFALPNASGFDIGSLGSPGTDAMTGGGMTPLGGSAPSSGGSGGSFSVAPAGSLSLSGSGPDVLSQAIGSGMPGSQAVSPFVTGSGGTSTSSEQSTLDGARAAFGGSAFSPSGSGGGNILSQLGLGPKSILPAGALAYALINSMSTPSSVKGMSSLANTLNAEGQAEQNNASAALNGQLSGPAQAAINQALQSAQAQIRSKYAAMGESGGTAEAEDLAQAQLSAVAQQFAIGQQIAQTGFSAASSATGEESQLLNAILQANTQQGTALGNSLAQFAAAAARGG